MRENEHCEEKCGLFRRDGCLGKSNVWECYTALKQRVLTQDWVTEDIHDQVRMAIVNVLQV